MHVENFSVGPAADNNSSDHVVAISTLGDTDPKAAKIFKLDGQDSANNQDIEAVVAADDHAAGGSGIPGTVANLVNTIIGSGVLALPSCAAKTGWALAIILLFLSGLITWVGVYFLTECARRLGGRDTSFGHAASVTYPWLIVIVDLCVWAVSFGLCVAYLTIASDNIPFCVRYFAPTLGDGNVLLQNWFWLLVCWVPIAMPLSMLRSVKFLGYTSALAILCVLYTTTVVILYTAGVLDPCAKAIPAGEMCRGDVVAFNSDAGAILMSIPVYFTAFCCSSTIFNIYNSMANPTPGRINTATISCVGICFALYIVIALCGYFTYGSNVAPNVLNSFPVETYATIARLGTAFVVTVSYPLLMHPARDAITDAVLVLSRGRLEKTSFSVGVGKSKTKKTIKGSSVVFYTVALLLNILAAALAFFNLNLDLILSITGSFGVVNLSLTIPFAFYFKMFEDSPGFKRMLCVPGMVFGLAASVVCAYYSIAPLFSK